MTWNNVKLSSANPSIFGGQNWKGQGHPRNEIHQRGHDFSHIVSIMR